MSFRTQRHAIAFVLAIGGTFAGCGSDEIFVPQLANGERLIDIDAVAQLSRDDEELEQFAVVGDLDGDGIDDAVLRTANVILSPSGGVIEFRSVLYILYGGTTLSGKIDYATLPSLDNLGSFAFGDGVAAIGDVDGDGLADFLVSASRAPGCGNPDIPHANDHPNSGAFLIYGSTTRRTGTQSITDASVFLRDPTACTFAGEVSALGDLDGDGKTDFAIGKIPPQPPDGPTQVFVFYGRGKRLAGTLDITTTADAVISASSDKMIVSPHAQRIGDIDGDGHDDFVLQQAIDQTTAKVQLVRGSATRLAGPLAVEAIAASTFAVNDYCLFSRLIGAALGDLDGDGFDDFSLTGCQDNLAPVATMGHHIFYGSAAGFPAQVSVDTAPASIGIGEPGGLRLVSADLDGDGHLDLIVGTPEDHDSNGAVRLLKGNGARLSGKVDPSALPFGSLGPTYIGRPRRSPICGYVLDEDCIARDELGYDINVGDLNGDGRLDLLIEAPGSQLAVAARDVHGSALGHVYVVTPPGSAKR